MLLHAAPGGNEAIHQCHAWACLQVVYLQLVPPMVENETTTHRMHRTHSAATTTPVSADSNKVLTAGSSQWTPGSAFLQETSITTV